MTTLTPSRRGGGTLGQMLAAATEPTPDVVSTVDELKRLESPYRRPRIEWVGREAAMQACPAELESGTVVVLCTEDSRGSDVCKGVQHLVEQRTKKPPRLVLVTPVVLLTVVRERIQGKDLGGRGHERTDRSGVSIAFRDLVAWAVRSGASDLHLNINEDDAESQVRAHIDGIYVAPHHLRMPTARLMEIARVAWLDIVGGHDPVFDAAREQQGRLYEVIDGHPYMLRWGSYVTDHGPSITLRILDLAPTTAQSSFGELGYLPSHVDMLRRAQRSEGGAVIFGGTPGSGKSTTIAVAMGALPATRKLMTLEDPVERRIAGALQSSIPRALDGSPSQSLRAKLMAIKRSSPSDVLVGEVRDQETGQAVQDILQAGTNVYTTVHVSSAVAIPQRLASDQVGILPTVLGAPGMLKLLVYQALLPRLCPRCALPGECLYEGGLDAMGVPHDGQYWRRYLDTIARLYGVDVAGIRVRNPMGCPHCQDKGLPELYGYSGRTVVAEMFDPSDDPQALRAIVADDVLRLTQLFAARRTAPFHDADMTGKSAMECAVYKMLRGELDPRDIEPRFRAFETVALARQAYSRGPE